MVSAFKNYSALSRPPPIMSFNKLIGIPEQPAKADKSAPTGIRGMCLKPIIGPYGCPDYLVNVHNRRWARSSDTRFAEAPTLPAPVWVIVYKPFIRPTLALTRVSRQPDEEKLVGCQLLPGESQNHIL